MVFLSTLSLRRATFANFEGFYWWVISIHALLAESDVLFWLFDSCVLFLSTLSLRRATVILSLMGNLLLYFYPRSPCGERRVTVLGIQHRTGISIHALLAESDRRSVKLFRQNYISIHALLAESDSMFNRPDSKKHIFLSTLSLRRATNTADKEARKRLISIHALLAESDLFFGGDASESRHFYPRSPCGERRELV